MNSPSPTWGTLRCTHDWQGQGVARKLLQQALAMAKGRKPDLTAVNVHASPNAVDVYKALGFEVTGEEQLNHGICFSQCG